MKPDNHEEIQPMKGGKYIAVGICLFISLVFAIPAYFTGSSTSNFLKASVTTTATVIDFKESKDTNHRQSLSNENQTLFQPVVKYFTQDSIEAIALVGMESNLNTYVVGDEVTIAYNPENVQEAEIKTFFQLWKLPLFLTLLASVFGLPAVYILVKEIF